MTKDVPVLDEATLRARVGITREAMAAVEAGFAALGRGEAVMPPVLHLEIAERHAEMDVKTAYVPGLPAFALKVSTGFFDNPRRGLPSLSAYVGDGANRWPAVHRLDAARLFRLALEKAPAGALHGAAEEGVPMRAIAETIGEGLGVPVRGISPDEARAHFDWMAMFVAVDNPTSSAMTRDAVGWDPQKPGLLADMRRSGYFS